MTATVRPPGDKSISHRVLMLHPLAEGTSRVRGLLDAADVRATAGAMRALGADVAPDWSAEVELPGSVELTDPARPLDCGNSGTTARILCGLLAGLGREAVLDGDRSLRSRPMERIVYPLQALGAEIEYLEEDGRLPVRTARRATGSLRPLVHTPRVASAQVKSALLLAGLAAGVRIEVREPGRSRDHTERLLEAMGAPVEWGPEGDGARAALEGSDDGRPPRLDPLDLRVPGDPSSAAFLAAASLLGAGPLEVRGVSLNPTRTGWLEVVRRMGGRVASDERGREAGEPVGDLQVRPSRLEPFRVRPSEVPRLLDEVPVLAVLAARTRGTSSIRGAGELRVKESDRLALLAGNLQRLGVTCREYEDGLEIEGTDRPLAGRIRTGGDHRMAMAFGALAGAGEDVEVDDRSCVEVSYPAFWADLERLSGESG